MPGKTTALLPWRRVLNFAGHQPEEDELEDLGVVMEDLADELRAGGAPREAVPEETDEAVPI